MAGTDKQHTAFVTSAPAVILVRPQLGENIGMCARAMLNCAVTELRIVAPRDGWPNEDAVRSASGATDVLDNAKIFATVNEAVSDLEYVIATTARGRGMTKDVLTADAAARHIRGLGGAKCGVMFGPERTGLENDEVALADAVLNIPLNPGFSSLNLAQAVLLVCHAWLSADNPFDHPPARDDENAAPATKAEIENLMTHLEEALDANGFFRSPDQKPTIARNIRNFFYRSGPTQQDIRTLHGVFACLTGKRSWK